MTLLGNLLRHAHYWLGWHLGVRPRRPENVVGRVNVTIRVRRGDDGPVIREIRRHNLVVNAGLNKLRDLTGYPGSLSIAYAPSNATPGYMAIGTGSTAAAAGQTALVTEVFRAAITRRVPDTAKLTFYYDLPTGSANGNTLREAGLFTEPTGSTGEQWARVTHSAIDKSDSISVQYQWDWIFGAA